MVPLHPRLRPKQVRGINLQPLCANPKLLNNTLKHCRLTNISHPAVSSIIALGGVALFDALLPAALTELDTARQPLLGRKNLASYLELLPLK